MDSSSRYTVQFKDIGGNINHEGVVIAQSPRQAIDVACRGAGRKVVHSVKYSSWQALRQAAVVQSFGYVICEVMNILGGRKNYYIVYLGGL